MATFPIESVNRGEVEISGSFATKNGGGTVITIYGTGFAVAYTGAGVYTVTFTKAFPTFLGAQAQLQLNTVDNWACQVKSFAAKVLTIRMVDGTTGAEVDLADNANNRINFSAKFLNVT